MAAHGSPITAVAFYLLLLVELYLSHIIISSSSSSSSSSISSIIIIHFCFVFHLPLGDYSIRAECNNFKDNVQ